MTRDRLEPAVRVLVCISLLALLWHYADGQSVIDQLSAMDGTYALAALALTVPQVAGVGLALEHHGIAARPSSALSTGCFRVLPCDLPQSDPPGGVAGDAARAWRHGRSEPAGFGAAARVVILERTSGQIALFVVVLAAALFQPDAFSGLMSAIGPWGAGLVAGVALVMAAMRNSRWREHIDTFVLDFGQVFSGWSGGVQMLLSSFVVATYLMVYGLAARSIGVELSVGAMMTVVPIILFSMVLPVSISGWGVREAVAAAFAASAGLTPDLAVAASVAYGLIVLVSSLPGLFVLLAIRAVDEADTLATSGR